MKIYGIYFVALMMNNWKEIVSEQIHKILNSELYKKTDKLYVRVFYEDNQELESFKQLIQGYEKIELSYTNQNEYEFGALRILKDLSKKENFYCYYLHSKGVSITEETYKKHKPNMSYVDVKKAITSWRHYMEYFLIEKYQECIRYLNKGFDTCGVQLRDTPRTDYLHYSGNFWWVNSSYIEKLPEIDSLDTNNRMLAEFWIGYGRGNYKCLYFTNELGYHGVIKENYKN